MAHSVGQGAQDDDALRLDVLDFVDPGRWRWRLTDPNGVFLADHEVNLSPIDPLREAVLSLPRYLRHRADSDKWPDDEARLLDEVGKSMGERIIGPVGQAFLDYGTPVTVRVLLPSDPDAAPGLLAYPLESAHVDGRPLALQDVSLVYEVAEPNRPTVRHRPIGDTLRMLAIFSLPTDQSALALRRERYELQQLIKRIAQQHRRAIELKVLQYGVTRDHLGDVLAEGAGWDVIHFSGHGLPANLVLEKPDGTSDLVSSDDLVKLARPGRGRLKLVSLSSCLSAAATIRETLRWLGIDARAGDANGDDSRDAEAARQTSVLARVLARELDCAVLAMRYVVGDDFAITLAADLYDRLFRQQQPLFESGRGTVPPGTTGVPQSTT